MKIKITGVNDELILKELAILNNNFFDEWKFVEKGANLNISLPNQGAKYDILKIYYSHLESATGESLPWGLLNGMRPTKLVHSMKKHCATDAEIICELQAKYLACDKKMNLLLRVANHQLKVIPDLYCLEKEVSIYIGIPFCPTRCAYCTFAAYTYESHKKWVAPVLEALLAEISLIGHYLKAKKINVTTVYLGGGTPTMLDPREISLVLRAICENITSTAEVREITVEAGRPDTISREKLELLKDFCVNRISINPQSFNQKTLDKIGRYHSTCDIKNKYKLAKDVGISNVNMDLIVGLPGENHSKLAHSLGQIKDLQPESLTVHMLALKRTSDINNERQIYIALDKEALQEMAQMTYIFSKREGYVPYYLYRQKNIAGNLENIGYAKAGFAGIYNILMMEEAQNVLGVGVGASSKFLIGESVHNPKDLRTYIKNYEVYALKKLELLELSMKIGAKSFVHNPSVKINPQLGR